MDELHLAEEHDRTNELSPRHHAQLGAVEHRKGKLSFARECAEWVLSLDDVASHAVLASKKSRHLQ